MPEETEHRRHCSGVDMNLCACSRFAIGRKTRGFVFRNRVKFRSNCQIVTTRHSCDHAEMLHSLTLPAIVPTYTSKHRIHPRFAFHVFYSLLLTRSRKVYLNVMEVSARLQGTKPGTFTTFRTRRILIFAHQLSTKDKPRLLKRSRQI